MSGEEDDKPRVSQLCKPLWNCLHDQSPLSILEYFIQFMTTRKALHLLQFWFSVASFKNALPSSTTEAPISSHHSITPTTSELLVQGDIESRCERSSAGILPPSQTSVEHNNQAMAGADNTAVVLPKAQNDDIKDHSSCHVSSSVRQSGAAVVEVKPSGCCGDGDCGVSCVGGLNGLNGRRGRERDGDKPEVVRGNQSSMESQREGKTSEITRQTSLNVVTDAIGIYSTYIALNALTPVHMPDDIRQRVEVNICPEDGIVDRTCFNEAQQFVYDLIENQYYPEFLRSPHLCKYQLELVSSGKLCLLDFLLGGDSLVLFMEFMEQENAMSLLQFWLTAESFYTHFSSQCNVEATVQDAIAIYDR
jgi:A-kinase anchor protein 10